MTRLRSRICGNRHWAVMLLAAALLIKLILPTGFMPQMADGRISIELCSRGGPERIVIEIPGLADQQKKLADAAGTDGACTFSGLAGLALPATDPLLLGAAIAFVMAAAYRSVPAPRLRMIAHLRPPLRGPPAAF